VDQRVAREEVLGTRGAIEAEALVHAAHALPLLGADLVEHGEARHRREAPVDEDPELGVVIPVEHRMLPEARERGL
jgi:hypothetical protein